MGPPTPSSDASGRMSRLKLPRMQLWSAYLALGALALVVHAALETGSLQQSWFYDVVGASAVAMAVVGVVRNAPDRRLPWLLMAAGQALFVAGDIMWNWYEMIGEEPFPSFADVLYLGGYPFMVAGIFLLIRRRIGGGDRGGVLDAAILTTACAILSWTFIIQPQMVDTEIDPLSLGISLAYPLMDLLLIGVAMGLLTTPGARTTSFRLLGASLMALVIADHAYAVQNLDGTYVAGGPIDTLYLISYLTFGAAVLHPSMRRLTEPHPVAVTWLGPVRMIGLAIAMITGPLLVTLGPDSAQGLTVVAVATAILSLLVLARLAGLVGLLERDVDQRRKLEAQLSFQAFHDPLTGLVNRRRFVEQAEAALAARAAPGSVAAMFLDLDDFKTVNDTLGHAAGDELLVVVAERLKSALRGSDVAARLGGDEFGVLLFDVDDVAYAKLISERLLKSVQEPLTIMGRQVEVGASIGIAIDTAAMRTVDDLLGDADVAMYQAKALGKGRSQVFAGAADRSDIPERAWSQPRQNVRRPAVGPAQLEPGAG